MNETIKTILNRRSVRSYSSEQIKDEELDLIIKAGLYAPSAHNQQPWHFTVVQDKKLIDNLNKATKEEMSKIEDNFLKATASNENYHIFYNSPTIIVISGEKSAMLPNTDCAAATQNMLLAAESLNIGTCWIGFVSFLFRSNKVQEYIKLLEIPEGFEPYYAVAVGYKTKENTQAPLRRENTVNYVKS
jgi:nitroreductase